MELRLAVEGRLTDFLARQQQAGARAVTSAVRRAASNLKNEMRRRTAAAGLDRNACPGRSVSKTWQDKSYPPRGASLSAAALVYSRFPAAMTAFLNGATVRAASGRWLAVPSEHAPRLGNRRLPPARFNAPLQFVRTRDPNVALLVYRERGGRTTVMYWLYRQVRVGKRLSLDDAAAKWAARIPDYAIAEWDRQAARRGVD